MGKILFIGICFVMIISCKKNNNDELTKKLASRFVIAGLNDSINYKLYNNDTTMSLLSDFSPGSRTLIDSIDFDNDKIYDLLLTNSCGNELAQNQNEIWIRTNYEDAQLNILHYGKFAISGPFSYMDTIDRKSSWKYEIKIASCSDISGCKSMDWMNIDNKYQSFKFLGLRFINKNDTLYGWARISPAIVIFDYAMNKK